MQAQSKKKSRLNLSIQTTLVLAFLAFSFSIMAQTPAMVTEKGLCRSTSQNPTISDGGTNEAEIVRTKIYRMQGYEILSEKWSLERIYDFSLSGMPPGACFIRINAGSLTYNTKLLLKTNQPII